MAAGGEQHFPQAAKAGARKARDNWQDIRTSASRVSVLTPLHESLTLGVTREQHGRQGTSRETHTDETEAETLV